MLSMNEERRRFNSLVNNIPGIVYRCAYSTSWYMYYISNEIEKISGFPATDFINAKVRSFASIIYAEDRAYVEDTIYAAVEDKTSYTLEYRIIDVKGNTHWVYEKGQALFDEQDNPMWLDGVIIDITDRKKNEVAQKKLVKDLQKAFEDIKQLSGLLPICAKCKKIRDDKGYWNHPEEYIEENSDIMFSHGLCPECSEVLYGEHDWFLKMKTDKKIKSTKKPE